MKTEITMDDLNGEPEYILTHLGKEDVITIKSISKNIELILFIDELQTVLNRICAK